MPGARHGTRSRDSRIMPGPKAGAKPLSHPGIPSPMSNLIKKSDHITLAIRLKQMPRRLTLTPTSQSPFWCPKTFPLKNCSAWLTAAP